MNSYPHEFLSHPQPLMFVAGLTTSNRDRASSITSSAQASSSRRLSDAALSHRPSVASASASTGAGSGLLDPAQSSSLNTLTTPITSPSLGRHIELPSSPPAVASPPPSTPASASGGSSSRTVSGTGVVVTPPTDRSSEQEERDRDHEKLVDDLRGALEMRSGKSKVWLPEAERKDFRILLVDKHIRLPARKQPGPLAPTSDHQPPPSHSPLSPLTPTSPAFPDGLIAPIWVRKHAELVPSVFVLFLRLWECPDPSIYTQPEELERKEKEEDDLLVKEIGERRRRLGERGIKLTVVLMASAAALDSPVLDPRLSYLRRTSSLSSKASLFVLTPVSADQLPEFVQSLQDAVYDAAIEYYSGHGKKIRRKRVRIPSGGQAGMLAGAPGKTLGPQGWAVRYDFKAGWFAELRGDLLEARRHYEDCWNELAKMFASTQTLPPRTKRWAEAKVLADCIAVRICRLLLYSGDAQKVLSPFYVHLKRFGDLSRGWGIGEETFEYWSWIARQYRIFAELLEMGQLDDELHIPILPPPIFPTSSLSTTPPTPEYYATPTSVLNPLQILQQPAHYYYTAADCTLKRKERFQEALAVEEGAKELEAGGHVALAPGFANEKKVDHAALAIELYTKAYSLLKDQAESQNRVALAVAFRIAETYCASGQHELAMRFFDRISHTFVQDRWTPIIRQIRRLWYECAQITGNVEAAARLLLEMMSPSSGVEGEDRVGLQDDLISLLKTTQPSSPDPILLEMNRDSALLDVSSCFWSSKADTGSSAEFQVSLFCDERVDIAELRFASLRLSLSDGRPDVVVQAGQGSISDDFIDLGVVEDGDKTRETPAIVWTPGKRITLRGRLVATQESEIEITSVKLVLAQSAWTFELLMSPGAQTAWYTHKGGIVPVHDLSASVSFAPRPLLVGVSSKPTEGYVGELVPIRFKVESKDDRKIHLRLSIFLQPGEEEEDDVTISCGEQTSSSLIQNLDLGLLEPTSTLDQVVHLRSSLPSTRVLDISLEASLVNSSDKSRHVEEIDHTLSVPISDPLNISSSVIYRHRSSISGGDGVEGWATVMSVLEVPGKRDLEIEGIKIEPRNQVVECVSSSLSSSGDAFPQRWSSSTSFSIASRFALKPSRRPSTIVGISNEPSADIIITWRIPSSEGEAITTHLPLPVLSLPPQDSFITAHLSSPPTVTQSHPARLSLSISNSHPSATATTLSLTVDPNEHFIHVGPKSIHVAPLPPGQSTTVDFDVVPVSGRSGMGTLPKVRLWEGVDDDREELDVMVLSDKGERVEIGGAFVQILP